VSTATKTTLALAATLAPNCSWSYAGANGPDNWGTICGAKYPLCASGTQQSPINIKVLRMLQGPGKTTIGWHIPTDAWNKYVMGGKGDYLEGFNGHAFEVSHADATFPFGGVTYKLQYFVTHTVSEHTVDGEHYDMEMQFVHTVADGSKFIDHKILIVAVFFKTGVGQGSPNWLRTLAASVPKLAADASQAAPLDFTEVAESVMVGTLPQNAKFKGFKPNYNNFMGYVGSLTTPPCTENVQWLVLANPIYAEQSELDAFKTLEGPNFRDIQPMNGRKVTKRYCGHGCS